MERCMKRTVPIRKVLGEYKKIKAMTDLELIFTMLGERVTTEISENEKPKTMVHHKKVAHRGGSVAGNARKQTEKEIGKSVVSKENYLGKAEKQKKIL